MDVTMDEKKKIFIHRYNHLLDQPSLCKAVTPFGYHIHEILTALKKGGARPTSQQ